MIISCSAIFFDAVACAQRRSLLTSANKQAVFCQQYAATLCRGTNPLHSVFDGSCKQPPGMELCKEHYHLQGVRSFLRKASSASSSRSSRFTIPLLQQGRLWRRLLGEIEMMMSGTTWSCLITMLRRPTKPKSESLRVLENQDPSLNPKP